MWSRMIVNGHPHTFLNQQHVYHCRGYQRIWAKETGSARGSAYNWILFSAASVPPCPKSDGPRPYTDGHTRDSLPSSAAVISCV